MSIEDVFLVPRFFWPLKRLKAIRGEISLPEWTHGSLWLEYEPYIVEEREGSFRLERANYPIDTWIDILLKSERIWIPLYKTNISVLTSAFLKTLINEIWERNYERKRIPKLILLYILKKLKVSLLRSLSYDSISSLCDNIVGRSNFPSIFNFALLERKGKFLEVEASTININHIPLFNIVKKAFNRFIEDLITLDRLNQNKTNQDIIIGQKSISFLINRSILHAFLSEDSTRNLSYDWIDFFLGMHVDEPYFIRVGGSRHNNNTVMLSEITQAAEKFVRTMRERLSDELIVPDWNYELYREYKELVKSVEYIYKIAHELSQLYEEIVSLLDNLTKELSDLEKIAKHSKSHLYKENLDIIEAYMGLLGLLSNTVTIPIIHSSIESLDILVMGDALSTLMGFYNQVYLMKDLRNRICSYLYYYNNLRAYLNELSKRSKYILLICKKIPFARRLLKGVFQDLREISKEIIKIVKKNKEELLFKLINLGRYSPIMQRAKEKCEQSLENSLDLNPEYTSIISVINEADQTIGRMKLLNGMTVSKARHASILTHGLLPNPLFKIYSNERAGIIKLSAKLLLSSIIVSGKLSLVIVNKKAMQLLLGNIDQITSRAYGQKIIEKSEEEAEDEKLEEMFFRIPGRVSYILDKYLKISDLLTRNSLIYKFYNILISDEKINRLVEYLDSIGYYIPELLLYLSAVDRTKVQAID